jgi:hypothetical protein
MPVKEVSFQVSIVPSLSQVGISPILIGETSVSAIDTFTNTEVVDTRPAITTGVQNDPSISGEDGSVVE